MKLKEVGSVLRRALQNGQSDICAHITSVEAEGRTTAIEAAFARCFESELPDVVFEREQPLSRIRTKNYWEGRTRGQIDCFIPSSQTAFEYKAIRLPRRTSDTVGGARYDIAQLASDHLRLSRARKLEQGFVVAFVYGPLVVDSASDGKLYKAFHNQMFVDYSVARANGQIDMRTLDGKTFVELGWNSPKGEAQLPEGVSSMKVGSLGAICISCRTYL